MGSSSVVIFFPHLLDLTDSKVRGEGKENKAPPQPTESSQAEGTKHEYSLDCSVLWLVYRGGQDSQVLKLGAECRSRAPVLPGAGSY